MATQVLRAAKTKPAADPERGHRWRMLLAVVGSAGVLLAIAFYGARYYTAPLSERIGDPLHALLRPSGAIGIRLGQIGLGCMALLYLYGIRKHWPWLRAIGNTRHWLDFHILLGITGPLLVTFHSSFKLQGLAGVAFWVMWTVVMSGFVGRYFYGQIPRSMTAAELSMKEMEAAREALAAKLESQRLLSAADLAPLFRLPGPEQVQRMSLGAALGTMIWLDAQRPFQVSRLRRKALPARMILLSLGGLLPFAPKDLEMVIATVRKQAWLSMKISFLSKAQAVFHLWHVIHRPFSYSLAALALIHVATVLLFGYF
ncbi:MAG TPA: hypothetical protein VNN17_08220 [Terriglobia bacterium]|nr:hypothetical protein [Terriglobia bacterium]